MDTPVIDLTAAPDSPGRAQSSSGSSSSASSQEAPLVATSLTSRNASNQDTRNVNAVAGGSSGGTAIPSLASRRRLPYPTNAASTPIDLTDDDIEYLGEHRLHLPDQPHVQGNDARPVAGDNYSLMDRLRDAAGMPFSRHASSSSSSNPNNNRVIEEDPLRFGVATGAGPGPAAVAAANARARRNATNSNDNAGNPPAGLNARRNRQRVQNAHNANNNAGADPAPYYYRRVQPPPPAAAPAPRRPARAGRRGRDVYQGILPGRGNEGWEDDVEHELYRWLDRAGDGVADGGGDFDDFADVEFQPHVHHNLGGLLGAGGAGRRNNNNNAGRGALQGIMQLLGFGHHLMNNGNAQPINHQHIHFNHANPPKRKVKAYSVKQSHPTFNKKKDGKDGFERDIIPPPEIEEEPEVEAETEKLEPAHEEAPLKQSQEVKEDSIMEIQPEENAQPEATASASTRVSGRNKGKGRALEIDISSTNSQAAAQSLEQQTNSDIPILDLASRSPNTSASTSSSALFSGKLSNSTRATSADQHTDSDTPKILDSTTQIITEAPSESIKPKTRTIRAPVCTSCSNPLFLNQSSKGRPYILLCGHVVCKGCLDKATERLKRWTMDEPEVIQDDEEQDIGVPSSSSHIRNEEEGEEDDGNSSLPPLPTKGMAWKGARLKESFEEVDRSRSSTIAETNTGRALTKDRKGKKKEVTAGTSSANASTSAGVSASTSTSTRASGRGTRRNATRPDYAELDGDEEGQPDGSYVPRSARDGMDDDDDDVEDTGPSAQRGSTDEEDDEEATLRNLVRKKPENEPTATSSRASKTRRGAVADEDDMGMVANGAEDSEHVASNKDKGKGEGKIKIVMNGVLSKSNEEEVPEGPSSSNNTNTTATGKRKRGKEDNEGTGTSGKSTSAKGKKQKVEKPPLIDIHWLTCPVNGCKGGTDLSKAIGTREGAWELFV